MSCDVRYAGGTRAERGAFSSGSGLNLAGRGVSSRRLDMRVVYRAVGESKEARRVARAPCMRGHEMTTEQVRGRQVFDKGGNRLGSVEDVTFDPEALRVTGFIVKMDREAAERLHLDPPVLGSARLQVSAERLATLGDGLMLNIEQRDMAGMLYGRGP